MALEKSTVSINLGNGIDQKTDDKIGPNDSFSYSRDLVFQKIGKIYKRYGTETLSDDSYYPLDNPLTVGPTDIPNNVIGFKDQLLLQNKGAFYSRYESDDTWYFKGHHYPVTIEKQVVHANQNSSYWADSATLDGITAYAYIESTTVRLTVIEEETNNYIINNYQLDVTPGAAPIINPKIVKFANAMYVTWQLGSTLKIANIPSVATTAITVSNLQTDVYSPVLFDNQFNKEGNVDWVYVNQGVIGERNLGAYLTTGNSIKVFSIKNDGTIDATMGSNSTLTSSFYRGCSIYYNTSTQILYVAYCSTVGGGYSAFLNTYTISSGSIASGSTITVETSLIYPMANATMITDPADPLSDWLFYDQGIVSYSFNTNEVFENIIKKALTNGTVITEAASLVMQGMMLSGKAIADSERQTVYLPSMVGTTTQSTDFILDVFRGRADGQPNILVKANYGDASPRKTYGLPRFESLSSSVFYVPVTTNTALVRTFSGLFLTGISRLSLNLKPQYAASEVVANSAVYLSGGYLGYYDGSSVYEQGFFINPEPVSLNQYPASTALITISVTQQGTASLPEITSVTFPQAGVLQTYAGVGPASYWTFVTPTTTFVVWYRINGSGTAPGAAGTKIQVDLDGTETAIQVKEKTRSAILNAASGQVTINTSVFLPTMTITNSANGVVSDATVTGMTTGSTTGLTAATYQYAVIYSFLDNSGQEIVSAPSTAVSITVSGANAVVGVVAWAPPITNKQISSIFVQLYRTESNGSILKRVGSAVLDKPFAQTRQQVSFTDIASNADIANNEALYTTGGILPNFSPGSTRHISLFKNRLLATNEDNNSIFYSKTGIQDEAIEFAQELTIDLLSENDSIEGHRQLDDKLIIFKREQSLYVAGDGANDLGQNATLTLPTVIASDTGTDNHNSIIQYPDGLLFKSSKGLYLLNRSLQMGYIGKEVEGFNSFDVSKAVLLQDENQIRFELQNSTECLMYDYYFRKWQVFSQYNGTYATIWRGRYTRVDYDGLVRYENKGTWIDSGSLVETYNPSMTTKWLQLKNVQDYQRIYRLAILGDLKSPHVLKWKIYYDYDDTQFDEYEFNSDNIYGTQLGDQVYEPIIHLRQQKCDAIKIEMTIEANGGSEECLQLVDMAMMVGVKRGLMKVRARKML